MKKLLLTLLVLCVAICTNANTIYELSAATCTAATKATGPWAFNNGFSIMPADESKTYQSANGGIKYSADVKEEEPTGDRNTNLYYTPESQMEKLDRAPVALPASSGKGVFLSWRFLGTDNLQTKFDVVRNGSTIKRDLSVTNFTDATGANTSSYVIVAKVNGEEVDRTEPVSSWGNIFRRQTLDRPAGGTIGGAEYTYSPNDCSVGDVDGDGKYELIVKWDPSNSHDNSQSG